jgi:predicted DNA-binding protein
MASQRISVRVPDSLVRRLKKRSALKGSPESEVVREALEAFLSPAGSERSAYEVAEELGLIGCVRKAPKDLSTNRKYLRGFGKGK